VGTGRRLKLFYTHPDNIYDNELFITGSEAHHALHVLRLRAGTTCEVFDGKGATYIVKLFKQYDRQRIKAVILERRSEYSNQNVAITLAQAIPQKQKFDSIVEKATELGGQ